MQHRALAEAESIQRDELECGIIAAVLFVLSTSDLFRVMMKGTFVREDPFGLCFHPV